MGGVVMEETAMRFEIEMSTRPLGKLVEREGEIYLTQKTNIRGKEYVVRWKTFGPPVVLQDFYCSGDYDYGAVVTPDIKLWVAQLLDHPYYVSKEYYCIAGLWPYVDEELINALLEEERYMEEWSKPDPLEAEYQYFKPESWFD